MILRWNRLGLICVAGLCALGISQRTGWADDGPASPNVVGSWGGRFQSSTNPDSSGPVSLFITGQDGRRFLGLFLTPPSPITPPSPVTPPSPIRGTVSASGEITIVVGDEAAIAVAHGTLRDNLMMLDYEIHTGAGGVERGSMILLAGGGDSGPPG